MLNINKTLYFFIFIVIVMVVTYLSSNLLVNNSIIYKTLGGQFSVDRIDRFIETQQKWLWLTYLLIPVFYLIKFSLVTFCLYIGSLLILDKIEFKKLFQITLLAEIVFLVPAIFKLYWFLLIQQRYSLEELQYFSPLSLLGLFGYETIPKWSIYPLQLINVFELIYWLLLAYGLHLVIKKPFKKSLRVVAASYGTGLVLWVVFITFLTVSIGV